MNKHFAHLHLHTEFSLLDGAIRITDLMKVAKEQQWKAVGLSDHGNIFGAVKFFQEAKKQGIKPVLGIEMYLAPDVSIKNVKEKYYHIILIVQNRVGYRNLCKILAFAYQEGFYFKPRVDYKTLEKYSEGLIVSTACVGGHVPTLLREGSILEAEQQITWFQQVFGPERFFFEVSPPDIEKQIITNQLLFEYAQKHNVKIIASGDAHYLTQADHEAHEVLLAIQTKHTMADPNRMTFGDFKGHLKTTADMLSAFKDHEEVVWNTGVIADSCEFNFEFGKLFFPLYPIPEHHTQDSYFKELCIDGYERLKKENLIPEDQHAAYLDRLILEANLIIKMGYVGYFLVVSDFIQWAKNQGIPVGPGRGSAAGSLVAWALQITNVDPIKYNLLFERFLNPERVSMPDIDIDFCIEGREKVINYVKQKYGQDCVCQIITFGTMMAKGVVKDVARVLGFPFQDANNLTNLISDQLKITLSEAIEQEPKLKEMIEGSSQVKHLFDLSFRLEGITRHASKHAAGIVISPQPLDEVLPLYAPAKGDDLVSQYAMTELEALGFLKMDFLGLKNLTIVDRALQAIEKNHGIKINLDKLALDDKKTFELLAHGKTNGVFQFESDGIKDVMIKLVPTKFEDLIAVNALYRPGPLGSGMVDDFIERRHGRKKITYMFDELEPVLAETYGVIVYQEQVMKIASVIAGYSLGAADILRKAMGKKKADVMAEQKALFVQGAKKLHKNERKAEELFDIMAYFAGYGFNKSHSTAYALIAYHTAYLKAHYPHEFMAALVSFETHDPDALSYYLQEISDMGIKTIPPHINESEIEFAARNNAILFGLQGIKNVGDAALKNIMAVRTQKPFSDLLDFCKRVDLRSVNKRVMESLICAGAFDSLAGNRAQKMAELDKVMALASEAKESLKTGQMDLFGLTAASSSTSAERAHVFSPLEEWPDKVKLEKEKEVAGFYLSSHPLKSYENLANWFPCSSLATVMAIVKGEKPIENEKVVTFGMVQTTKTITTKKGDKMAFMQLEDMSGHAEIVIFPRTYQQCAKLLDDYNVFVVIGVPDFSSETKCKIKADKLIPLDTLFSEKCSDFSALHLEIPSHAPQEVFDVIKTRFSRGHIPVHVKFQENGQTLLARNIKKIVPHFEALQILEKHGVSIKFTWS